ncbi:hypothetical protein FNV58_00780 (plasmid) [Streptomyces sp. RLB1-9]|uniref:hypothetical protein n=1 Tax=Streptomyces sp. RLB1-9 TaxID=2594454 RepID=UPI0011630C5C|nr:hypothetical protein [Streptomyces sp. RLB1-9]QDN94895.1 hypothetical protein FNV58_00780 [Streptomyces sp. RLB1-9]
MHGDLNDYWNYILSGIDVVGLVALRAVGKKDAKGWLWAMFTQAVWMVYSVSTLQWGFLAVAAVKFGVYTWNWISWIRSDKAEAKPKTREELALELARERLPKGTDELTILRAASMLSKALKVVELYPEQTKVRPTT